MSDLEMDIVEKEKQVDVEKEHPMRHLYAFIFMCQNVYMNASLVILTSLTHTLKTVR